MTRAAFEAWARESFPGVDISRSKYGDPEMYSDIALDVRWSGFRLGRQMALEEAAKLCEAYSGDQDMRAEAIRALAAEG